MTTKTATVVKTQAPATSTNDGNPEVRAAVESVTSEHGTVTRVLAASKRALAGLEESDSHLQAWQAIAFQSVGQVSARVFAEYAGTTNKNLQGRLANGHVLREAYAKRGFIVSAGKCQTFTDRATADDMKAALAALKSGTAIREGRDPLALGTPGTKTAERKGGKPAAKRGPAKGSESETVTVKPAQYGLVLDLMTANVGMIPSKQRASVLAAARTLVEALESTPIP